MKYTIDNVLKRGSDDRFYFIKGNSFIEKLIKYELILPVSNRSTIMIFTNSKLNIKERMDIDSKLFTLAIWELHILTVYAVDIEASYASLVEKNLTTCLNTLQQYIDMVNEIDSSLENKHNLNLDI